MNHIDPNERFCQLMRRAHDVNFGNAVLPRDALEEVQALIDSRTLDYALARESGETVMGGLLIHVEDEHMRDDLLARMFRNGLNPLNSPAQDRRLIIKTQGVLDQVGRFAVQQEQQGDGLRDEQGGNLLHWLARHQLWKLVQHVVFTRHNLPRREDNAARVDAMIAWIGMGQQDGSTPMHAIWEPQTLDNHLLDLGEHVDERERIGRINSMSIYLNALMIPLGADLLCANQNGVRVLDLMEARDLTILAVQDGDTRLYHEWLAEMLAEAQTRILEQDTPVAGSPGRGAMRL